MGTFTKNYDVTEPDGSTESAYTIDDHMQDDKVATSEAIALEHNALEGMGAGDDDSLIGSPGRHTPGYVAAVLIAGTSSLPSSGIVTGCLAIDTDTKSLKIYNGSNWTSWEINDDQVASRFAFSAYLNTEQNNIASGSNVVVKIDTEAFDDGSVFDVTTFRYTPTVAGLYQLSGAVNIVFQDITRYVAAFIIKNGSVIHYGSLYRIGAAGGTHSVVTCIAKSDGTDYFELGVIQDGGTDEDISIGATRTYFQGYLVART